MAACCDAQVSGGEKEEGSRRELGSPMWLANLDNAEKAGGREGLESWTERRSTVVQLWAGARH